MSAPVKLDENLGLSAVALLRDAGYVVDRVHDQGLSGAADEVVWQRVCAENRFFVTLDLDFSDVRRFPPGSHVGILLLRPRSRGRRDVLDILKRVLAEQTLERLRGCLVVADQGYTRIRRPPAQEGG